MLTIVPSEVCAPLPFASLPDSCGALSPLLWAMKSIVLTQMSLGAEQMYNDHYGQQDQYDPNQQAPPNFNY